MKSGCFIGNSNNKAGKRHECTHYGEPDGGTVTDAGVFGLGLIGSDVNHIVLLQVIIRRQYNACVVQVQGMISRCPCASSRMSFTLSRCP